MSTPTTQARFEDRLLDALLVEFDAPTETRRSAGTLDELATARASRGPIPTRRSSRSAMWAGSAAAIALLAGAVWAVAGGLDGDRTPITVAAPSTTAIADVPYLEFADMSHANRGPVMPVVIGSPGTEPTSSGIEPGAGPGAVSTRFRPRSGGGDRAIIDVSTQPDLWHAAGGTPATTPGGIAVYGTPLWSDPTGPWTSVLWQAADGTVMSVRQSPESSQSYQQLQLVSTTDLLAFVDGLTLTADGFTQSVGSYEPAPHDANNMVSFPSDFLWSLQSQTETTTADPMGVLYGLTAMRGTLDIAGVAGTRVTVRGTDGVVGSTRTPLDGSTALVWNESGVTMKLTASGGLAQLPTAAQMTDMANGLRRTTKADFEAVASLDPGPAWRTLRLDIPENDGVNLAISVRYLDETGATVGYQPTSGTTYGGPSPRHVDLMFTPAATTALVWLGSSTEPPACAQHVDLGDSAPERAITATLDLGCTS